MIPCKGMNDKERSEAVINDSLKYSDHAHLHTNHCKLCALYHHCVVNAIKKVVPKKEKENQSQIIK